MEEIRLSVSDKTNAFSYFVEPTSLVVSNQHPTGFTISITPPKGNPAVTYFTIAVGNESQSDTCKIDKKETTRHCDFEGLTSDTEYPVHARSCLPGHGGCSVSLDGKAKTKRL